MVDIEGIARIAHAHKIPLVVDNTFATPYLVQPIAYGADIVVHSATKFIGGHGTAVGGVIVEGGSFDWEASGRFPSLTEPNESYHGVSFTKAAGPAAFVTKIRAILLRDTGATLSPFHAFLFLQGLETLSLRVERHVSNALKVASYLASHPQVEKVHHPSVTENASQKALYSKYFPNGGGSIFTFEIKGDDRTAKKFIDHLQLFSLLANVADVKSLVIHPASTTHGQLNEEELRQQGIRPNTIRLSVGTEHIDDILQDLEEAFRAVAEENKNEKIRIKEKNKKAAARIDWNRCVPPLSPQAAAEVPRRLLRGSNPLQSAEDWTDKEEARRRLFKKWDKGSVRLGQSGKRPQISWKFHTRWDNPQPLFGEGRKPAGKPLPHPLSAVRKPRLQLHKG